MGRPYRIAEAQVLAKVEATAGTAETLASADMFVAQNVQITPNFANNMNEGLTGLPDRELGATGMQTATISYDVILKGSGTAGTAPGWRDSIMACGASETIVGGTSVTYKPAAAESYYTFGCIYPGLGGAGEDILFRLAGCQGTCKLSWKSGGFFLASFTQTGVWVAPSDSTMLSVPTWDTSVPYAFMGAAMTFHAVGSLAFETFEFDLGNTVEIRPNANSSSGALTGQITSRRPVGSVDFEQEKLATFNLFTRATANTTGAIDMTASGTAGNLIDLSLPKVRFFGPGLGARAGALLSTAQYEAVRSGNAGLDTYSLILT